MKLIRSIVNHAFRAIYKGMDAAHPDDIAFYFNGASKIAPMKKRHRALVRSKTFRDTVYLISRAIAQTPYGEPLKLPEPMLISIATSDFCPLACSNCYSNSVPVNHETTRTGSIEVFQALAKTRTPYFIITGGEPLLDRELEPKLRALLEAGKQIIVSSNLSVAPLKEIVHEFPGQVQFFFPLWGAAEHHDFIRGRGSYRRLEGNIELTEDWPCIRTLYVLLESAETEILEEAIAIGSDTRNLEIRITRKFNVGRLENKIAVPAEVHHDYLRSHYKALRRVFTLVQIDIPELSFQVTRTRHKLLSWIMGIRPFDRCGAGNRLVHVSAAGGVYPCYAFEQTKFVAPNVQTDASRGSDIVPQFEDVPVPKKCAAEVFDHG